MYAISITDGIANILKTPVGSRVMRPLYGSRCHELIDRQPNDEWKLSMARYVAESINTWEPRVDVVRVTPVKAGEVTTISIEYEILLSGERAGTEVEL